VALSPAHATDLDELLDAADDAMYRAKREGAATAIAHPKREQPADVLASIPTG